MKVTYFSSICILLAACVPNSINATRKHNKHGIAIATSRMKAIRRGGVLTTEKGTQKRRSLFGMVGDKEQAMRVPDMNSRDTKVETQSTVVEASTNDVDIQYRNALIKTALTVVSAGTYNMLK